MAKNIIDVSTFQGDIDFEKVAKQVDGVIIRCGITYWGNFVPSADKSWEANYKGFTDAGVPVGAYYYGVAKNAEQAKQEAAKCLELLKGKQLEYPIYYDVECAETQGNLTKEQLTEIVDTFCSIVEAEGYFVGIYTTLSWAQAKLDYPALAKKYTSWIAWIDGDPSTKLTPAPAAWQYSWTGRIDGIQTDVDQDYFYQDFPSIIKGVGLNGYGNTDKPAPEPEETTITLAELNELLRSRGITQITL
jgi:glycoside hydrolase family 25|uniref:lysozyme n=1 Tax=Myoviridae sp. ctHP32 TaxID=2823539 RepID=A0A8S5LFX1_9CAUD|nr:MAG TPA: endolysin [Myoviridae sp. ctHP32]